MLSTAGLNFLLLVRGRWNKLLQFGFRWLGYLSTILKGHLSEPGLSTILPSDSFWGSVKSSWWFFVAKTAPGRCLLSSQYFSPLEVCRFISIYFFMAVWFSRPLWPRNRDITNQAVCCSCCCWRVLTSTSSPASYKLSTISFVSGLLWTFGAISPFLFRVLTKQLRVWFDSWNSGLR